MSGITFHTHEKHFNYTLFFHITIRIIFKQPAIIQLNSGKYFNFVKAMDC